MTPVDATISLFLAVLAATAAAREGDIDYTKVRWHTMVALMVTALIEGLRVLALFWGWQ